MSKYADPLTPLATSYRRKTVNEYNSAPDLPEQAAEKRAAAIKIIKKADIEKGAAEKQKPKKIEELSDIENFEIVHAFKTYRKITDEHGAEHFQQLYADKKERVWATMNESEIRKAADQDATVNHWFKFKGDCLDLFTVEELIEDWRLCKEQEAAVRDRHERFEQKYAELKKEHLDDLKNSYNDFHLNKAKAHLEKINQTGEEQPAE